MFGLKFAKFEPNYYVYVIKKGKIAKSGKGLSFWFYKPTTSIIKVPVETINVPFVFEELSNDFQTLTIQGDFIYKISDPEKIMEQVNFTIGLNHFDYLSDDPEKLDSRIVNIIKTIVKSEISNLSLREAMQSIDKVSKTLAEAIRKNDYLKSLGIDVTNINILSILPNKETARALEAETRENILKEADDAVYKRRNSAVEQERKIKENELNTEIAVKEKQRQIQETQIESERIIAEKKHVIAQEELAFNIKQEEENTKLIDISVKNRKTEADIKAYSLKTVVDTLSSVNPEIIKALTQMGMDSDKLIANAFTGIAQNAEKIGELNISPELLQKLLSKDE